MLGTNSCNFDKETVTNKEITNVIIETIKQESLDLKIPINLNLINRFVIISKQYKFDGKMPLPPFRNEKGEFFDFRYLRHNKFYNFNEQDSIFMVNQVVNNKNVKLDFLQFRNLAQLKDVEDFTKIYKEESLYTFILPLFNKEKNFVMLEYDYTSNFVEGSYGMKVYLKKHNDKWKLVESHSTWF